MLKMNTFLLSLLFLGGCFGRQDLPVKGNSDFEEMLIGFPDCDVENIYLDPQTKNSVHKYFLDRDLNPRLIVTSRVIAQDLTGRFIAQAG